MLLPHCKSQFDIFQFQHIFYTLWQETFEPLVIKLLHMRPGDQINISDSVKYILRGVSIV